MKRGKPNGLPGLRKFISKIDKYDAKKELRKQVLIEQKEILKVIKAQLASGFDGDGEKVYLMRRNGKHYDYAIATINKKRKFSGTLSGVTDRITNFQTGEFYGSLYLHIYDDGDFDVLSKSRKYPLITARSGTDLLKLSPQGKKFLYDKEIAPDLQAGINALFYDII